jgi:ABC-2 type transport system permease protein
MTNIVRRLFSKHRGFLIAAAMLLGAFQVVTCAIISSVNVPAMLEQFLAFAPPVVRAVIEQTMFGGSTAGILAFTWNHPVTHALATSIAIAFGASAVAGEIENGVIELMLAQPISRTQYLMSHLLFAIASMIAVAFAGLGGALIGQHLFGLEPFAWGRLLRLLANLVLLQMSFYSVTLLFSAFGREAGRVAMLAVMIAIVSFLDNVIATLWNKAAFMKPYSLHTYYDPRAILVEGHLAGSSVIVLSVFIAIGLSGAFARFLTRDLP